MGDNLIKIVESPLMISMEQKYFIVRQPHTPTKNNFRHKSPIHSNIEENPLPSPISTNHNRAQLYTYFFFVNVILILHTKYEKINFFFSSTL